MLAELDGEKIHILCYHVDDSKNYDESSGFNEHKSTLWFSDEDTKKMRSVPVVESPDDLVSNEVCFISEETYDDASATCGHPEACPVGIRDDLPKKSLEQWLRLLRSFIDLVVCNPPFGQEEKFLNRILEVTSPDTPVVLITSYTLRIGAYKGSRRWKSMSSGLDISSIVTLPKDIFKGARHPTEVLIIRGGEHDLKPHYFFGEAVDDFTTTNANIAPSDTTKPCCHTHV